MTDLYEEYCHADPVFFDSQARENNGGGHFRDILPSTPDNWLTVDMDTWHILRPHGVPLPLQGWKVHVSSGMDNAESVLREVYDYCVDARLPFKYLRSKNVLLARNSKYAPRAASGKLITIYPCDDEQLAMVLAELGAILAGEKGPYVLSDLRIGDGPLYVRYGGFLERSTITEDGALVPAVARPDGTLVPDERRPGFHIPDWVTPPEVLAPHLAARSARTGNDFPYHVTGALHFSNGGGVYLATRQDDGTEVILKEARPLAGLDREGTDAVTRLTREWHTLERLAGIPGIPAVYHHFTNWEHHFLAMQRMPGIPLGRWLAVHYPLSRHDAPHAEIADYTGRALHVLGQVRRLIAEVHRRGMVFGDLHDKNLLVDEDDSVSLIDFELASDVTESTRPALGAPGFAAPSDRAGFDIDDYALAALALWLFLPLNVVLGLDRGKLPGYLELIGDRFDLPADHLTRISDQLMPRTRPVTATTWPTEPSTGQRPRTDWAAVRESIAAAIVNSATPERTDRLFPGDIDTFAFGGACFECGAAGVLYALAACAAGRSDRFERWLVESVRREPPKRAGFYDGAHGVAHVLAGFGHRELAGDLVAEYAPLVPTITDHGLRGGLSGIGLNLLFLAETWLDSSLRDQALDIGERLVDALGSASPPGRRAKAGLLYGWSGPALLFTHLYRQTDDETWLGHADRAVLRDLAECVPIADGSLQVQDGELRTLPYLGVGSAGISVAIDTLATHRPDAECTAAVADLRRALLGEFVIQPGLLFGRAGLIVALDVALRRTPDPDLAAARDRHLDRLSWHAVAHRGRLAFPGNTLLRLSMDLGTGGAGVLLATSGSTAALPFLTPAAATAAAP
ncbi:MAG TPA: class III lanthionine synthetase LanKC [Pseudonocardiaceae bacterium]|nr:class III lanthionine synthetase LanKC [Pseudonocardiaceae bacterium]